MKLTTGYEFQGYLITEYVDVIFDEMLVGLGLGKVLLSVLDNAFSALTGREATEMIDKLNRVKQQLRDRVIKKARDLGANALIGIDFESSKLGDLMMVSMTATAVKIEKIVSPLPVTESDQKKLQAEAAEQEKQRAKEVQRQRLAALSAQEQFDPVAFMEILQNCESSREIMEQADRVAGENPDVFPDAVLEQLRGCLRLERMYGRGTGKTKMLSIVKAHLQQ